MHYALFDGKESIILNIMSPKICYCKFANWKISTVFSARGGCILEAQLQILTAALHITSAVSSNLIC